MSTDASLISLSFLQYPQDRSVRLAEKLYCEFSPSPRVSHSLVKSLFADSYLRSFCLSQSTVDKAHLSTVDLLKSSWLKLDLDGETMEGPFPFPALLSYRPFDPSSIAFS